MYFPDRGCVRPLRHLCGYATASSGRIHNDVTGSKNTTNYRAHIEEIKRDGKKSERRGLTIHGKNGSLKKGN